MFDDNGALCGVTKFATDVTQEKTEANRVASMVEHAPVNIMMCDLI